MTELKLIPVTMRDGSKSIRFESPYHPELPARLRAMGGKWNDVKRVWYLPDDMSDSLRALCLEIFAIDPLAPPTESVTLELVADHLDLRDDTLWLFGRAILRRPSRDMAVQVGEGVSILSGGFPRRGGSSKYPSIAGSGITENTVLRIRDVPRHAAQAFVAEHPHATILEPESAHNDSFSHALRLAEMLAGLWPALSADEKQHILHVLPEPKEELS